MKTKRTQILYAALVAGLVGAAKVSAQVFGQWDFDSGNLNATTGTALGYGDVNTQNQTTFGSTTALGVPNIGGSVAQIMKFPGSTNTTMGYAMTTPPANGRGTFVDNYTLIMDVLFPAGSDASLRSLLQADGGVVTPGADWVVTSGNQLSAPGVVSGGTISPNTWYRIGFVVQTNNIYGYVDGNQVFAGVASGGNLDRFDLSPSVTAPILGDNTANASAGGYVNSIQLRTEGLSEGQMAAMGTAAASGIPSTVPPVPSFIRAGRQPGIGQTGVVPSPSISMVLDQGSTTVNSSSIKLYMDGLLRSNAVVTPSPPTFSVTDSVANLLGPGTTHSLSLVWSDSVVGSKTNTWSFTVLNYQSVQLPPSFYMENFDELAEGTLPAGWVATNATTHETAGIDYCDPTSDAYLNWVVINTNRLCGGGPCSGFECDTLSQNPVVLNGSLINNLANNNILYFESDNRCNNCYGQIGVLFTADIVCTGRTNVFVAFNSLYTQNQDSIGALEYSIDQGAHWLPVLYYLDNQSPAAGGVPDVIVTNGVVDVGATFNTARADQPANGTNYGWFICAPVSAALIPYVAGRTNDDQVSSKRIEVVRLPQADGQATVRFRFVYGGTCSWYWGVDNFGLYEINFPVITTPPVAQTVDANTPVTFTVGASSPTPLTYQWNFNGVDISGATLSSYAIASAQPTNQGLYQVTLHNTSGSTPSAQVSLTVNTNPVIASFLISQVADPGQMVNLAPTTTGGRPLTYMWYKNGGLLGSATSSALTFNSIQTNDAGQYQLIVTNTYGSATSSVATVTVWVGPITNNLVAHLKFDGDLTDSTGRGNDATYAYNGTSPDLSPTFISGKLGQAFQYTTLQDGSKNDYATFGYPTDLQLDDTVAFSVSMWVNYTNQSDDLPFISNKDWNSSNNRGWGVFCQGGGNFRVQVTGINGGSDKFSVSPNTILRGGSWHNLVVSFVRAPGSAAGYVSSYVDGVLVDRSVMIVQGNIDTKGTTFGNSQGCTSGNPPLPDNQTDWALNIGQDGTGVYHDQCSAYNVGAYIDDLGVWRRALTGAEALAIYTGGNAGKDLSQVLTDQRLNIVLSGSNVIITWAGAATYQLYKSPTISPTSWTVVPNTLGSNTATVPISGATTYFKLGQ
jgi:hypothetical protein